MKSRKQKSRRLRPCDFLHFRGSYSLSRQLNRACETLVRHRNVLEECPADLVRQFIQVDKTLVRILARIQLRCDPSSRLRGSPVVLAGEIESERRNLE
jgi:hypothetical protein